MESDDDEENYIPYGTPLQELEEDTIVNKKAAQDLTVRDEKGRQRFHGAFTGGFSAGYFNSVGTSEGWEPSTYVSSRSQKAQKQKFQQNPEDFMDDEDFGEFGIAPKRIHTTANFRDEIVGTSKKRQYVDDVDSVIPGDAPLKDIVKPIVESIGIGILKKMGWRHGQGIGPKVKKENISKVIGCSLGPLGSDKEGSRWDSFLVAPDDTPDVPYIPKDDLHGIGYSGLSTHSVLSLPISEALSNSSTRTFLPKDKKKLSIRGQAFGVGALEDDDEDIYTKDDMSQYDFSEFAGPADSKHSSDKAKKSLHADFGLPILEGFCRTKAKAAVGKKYFSPPDLPPNYYPKPPSHHSNQQNIDSKTKLNPALRSILLGEKAFVKPAPSSIEKVPSLRKSRFDVVPEVAPSSSVPSVPTVVTTPVLSTPPGLFMSSKFKPFAKDELKQKRYEEFLKRGCDKDFLVSLQPKTLTEWERNQELDEFTKAAAFYRPLSKDLESRFESRSHLGVEIVSGLSRSKKDAEVPKASPETIKKSTKCQREVFEWHPSSLLCKRFNVPNPYPDSKDDGVPHSHRRKPALFDSMVFETDSREGTQSRESAEIHNEESISEDSSLKKSSTPKTDDSTPALLIETESVQEKPSMDLFKSIFCSSSSEASDGEDMETETAPEAPTTSSNVDKKESLVKPIPKQAFGVFANLDLDAINKRFSIPSKSQSDISSETKSNGRRDSEEAEMEASKAETAELGESYYGPELPPALPEASNISRSSRKISKRRHKHKLKKKKKKKSSKKKQSDSSGSSIDSEDDIDPQHILNKLKKLQRH